MSSRQFDAGASKTAPSRPGATGRTLLRQLSIPSDRLGASDQGMLLIGGEPASALLEKFGSPLYVAVEETIRTNYRRIQRAFAERWDAPINVMYAIKTNNALAVRAILSTEGAGGDCFGLGELHATERGGADLRRVVMNGSNKTDAELAAAVERDIVVNIDGPDEIPRLQKLATAVGRHARVNLRLKLLPPGLDDFSAEFFKSAGSLRESVRHSKWGMTVAAA
ncbi:MAG: hypothetical protein FJX52_16425, partial [Alphaproteobacteria bacterium]|nr:hypothetical protein [Alphaproteobacteria bacterium]